MLGLKRGEVFLSDHHRKWKELAATTINDLRVIFGDTARDIQHIGSTAICNIKAKPIIDIAVGVESFDSIADILLHLDKSAIYKRSHNRFRNDTLYVVHDHENRRTHQIHILIFDSPQWHNYIDFRDYMNACPEKAKEYENIKMTLFKHCLNSQTAYTDGKQEYMKEILVETGLFSTLRKTYDITLLSKVQKGWSKDKKYCIFTQSGTKYLLRLSPVDQTKRKKQQFELMQQVADLGVPMCQPIKFGTCKEGVYSIQSWIEGVDAEEEIPKMTDMEQYDLGLKAGRILQKIHSIPAPKTQEAWETRFNRKIDRKVQMYTNCPIKYENGHAFIEYINRNRHLLKNRPQCYQHGDYHIGNMMIDDAKKLYIIDFDRDDYGDPWEEFNRIVWCAQKAPLFACGMLDGYFDEVVPMDFWRLLALYISSNTLSSIPWAIAFGQSKIDVMLNQAREVLAWYDQMQNPVPTWYVKP